jgi:hypothetical protein
MATKTTNGTNPIASKTRKGGPRGKREILTPAQLREKLLKTMMLKETAKIAKRLRTVGKKMDRLQRQMDAATAEYSRLASIRDEYAKEAGGK